jgi:DivIVA domain-containing protein
MNDNSDLLPNLSHDDAFEVQLRGYSRRQVDEFLARCRSQIRDLEQRLERSHGESEELRRDLAAARQQALGAKPAHQEVSERIAQILKLADDEARSEKTKAQDEITQLRGEAQGEADRVRTEAREQAERMLTAAQEQAERAITNARAEAEKTRNTARAEAERTTTAARGEAERVTTTARNESERMTTTARTEAERMTTTARTEAERTTTEAQKKADNALATAKAQAKKALDEATARATAIHDGAERRLNHLTTKHSETMKRLTDILDGVSAMVAAEAARPSLEDEVSLTAAKTMSNGESAAQAGGADGHSGAGHSGAGHSSAAHSSAGHSGAGHSGVGEPAAGQPGVGQHRPSPPPPGTLRASAPRQQPTGQASMAQTGTQPGSAQSSSLPTESKRGGRAIDDDEQTEGVRIVPVRQN